MTGRVRDDKPDWDNVEEVRGGLEIITGVKIQPVGAGFESRAFQKRRINPAILIGSVAGNEHRQIIFKTVQIYF